MADLSHHHADKLVEVHGPASVLVDLLYDVVEVILCKCTVDLTEDFFQNLNLRKYLNKQVMYSNSQKILSYEATF